jgi:hypothetical protein
MGRKRRLETAEKKLKKVNVAIVAREHGGKVNKLYQIMERLIEEHHAHLSEAKIVIGWRFEKKEDADGRLWLGSLKKASDLDRSLHEYDFVMMLNHEFVNQAATDQQIEALIDHELCHGAATKDAHGEFKVDERGRRCYRIRKHDVEEFREIISRHGAWKSDLESFFGAWKEAKSRPLLDEHNQPRKQSKRFNEPALDKGETPPDTHLKNGNGKAHTNGHAGGKAGKAAKNRKDAPAPGSGSLEALDLPHPILEACQAAGFTTVEGVCQFVAENSRLALAELKNMGSERADALWGKIEEYQNERAVGSK